MAQTHWRAEITAALEGNKESWQDVESCTLTERELDLPFDDGYGCANGTPFTLWKKNHVYFPAAYDGAEWVAWVSRNPNDEPTSHIGGQ